MRGTNQEGAFHRISSATPDAPYSQEEGAGDGGSNKDSINIVELRECRDPPEEVDRAGNDRCRKHKQTKLLHVST